jgi:hypothetical protein
VCGRGACGPLICSERSIRGGSGGSGGVGGKKGWQTRHAAGVGMVPQGMHRPGTGRQDRSGFGKNLATMRLGRITAPSEWAELRMDLSLVTAG